jgi:hypothetical protein
MNISLIAAVWYILTCPVQYGYEDGACAWNNGVVPLSNDFAGDLVFDFPEMPSGPWGRQQYQVAGYLNTAVTQSLASYSTLTITMNVTTISHTPVFNYVFEPDNTCVYPAHVRPYIERNGDNGVAPNYRWWADDPYSYDLSIPGTVTITAPLSGAYWSNVRGQTGLQQPAGFKAALTTPMRVGVTVGGGCFYGHGVNTTSGVSQLSMVQMDLQ